MLFSVRHALGALTAAFALLSSSTQVAHADELCSITPGNYNTARSSYPQFVMALNELEKHSIATWYSDRNGDYASTMRSLVAKCSESSRLSVVVYGLPNKDCEAGYSNGGTVKNAADYVQFLNTLTGIIGNRKVLYVLEPDAVGLLGKTGGCAETSGYRENLKTAIRLLSANPNADIYLDVGYWTLTSSASASQVAATVKTLVSAGRVKGITLNTSNYRSNAEISELCWNFQNAIGSNNYHCVVDTSRNFVAPATSEWCNVRSAGIGQPPTSDTGFWNLDYLMWIKVPGESDGKCNDGSHNGDSMVGPDAGAFFADHFKLLWDQGYFVNKLNYPKVGSPSACVGSYGTCGSVAQGAGCCATSGEYCQPWDSGFYQCRPIPAKCGSQQVGVDFYGDDLATIYSILPEQCCERCTTTAGCKAYTFVNYNNDGRAACYLKTGTGQTRYVAGAVSAIVIQTEAVAATPAPASVSISPAPPSASSTSSGSSGSSTCSTALYGNCGNAQSGLQCCPSGQYCQPWNPTYYQCQPAPLLCAAPQVGADYYGNDLETVYGATPSECCAKCADTVGCKAYTFVNANSDSRTACYLKSGTGNKRSAVGAVSAEVVTVKTACATAEGGYCGNSQGTQCCPSGSYCQPWDSGIYQCIQKPAKCSQQLTNIDFYGNDLGTALYNLSPASCCAKCSETTGCKVYTFVNEGTPTCYLKNSTSGMRTTIGAVSGIVN